MKNLITFIAFLFSASQISAQVEAELTIENRTVSGSDFYFDLYLKTTATSAGDLFLGNADFVLTFASGDFSSPVLSVEAGNCTLAPTDVGGGNLMLTQDLYSTNTAVFLSGDEIIINLNGPAPADQPTFDGRVARIEGTAQVHRLGRFKISGLTTPNTNAGLAWKMGGAGIRTQVFNLGESGTFISDPVALTATDPDGACANPTVLVVTSATPISAVVQAASELSTMGEVTVPDGSARTFKAGESVLLGAEFEVELGAEFEAKIEGCEELE